MDKNNTKELTVVKENIFDKIKNFFKKLFSKQEPKEAQEIFTDENIKNVEKENSFINRVKIEEDNEEKRLLKLQSLIAEEIITEDELPEEDVKALHLLYDKQILELKRSIDEYKEKILKLRMNIKE